MSSYEELVAPFDGDPSQDALAHIPVAEDWPEDAVAIQRPPGHVSPAPPAPHAVLAAGAPLLTAKGRKSAMAIVVQGTSLMIAKSSSMGYTEGPERWEAFTRKLRVVKGEVPSESDCSASSEWVLFNAISHALGRLTGVPDVLSGENWLAGWTGTMCEHGTRIHGESQLGDLCFYGSGPPFLHVTIAVGGGMCVSHGSPGARKLPTDYRSDLAQFRRYF